MNWSLRIFHCHSLIDCVVTMSSYVLVHWLASEGSRSLTLSRKQTWSQVISEQVAEVQFKKTSGIKFLLITSSLYCTSRSQLSRSAEVFTPTSCCVCIKGSQCWSHIKFFIMWQLKIINYFDAYPFSSWRSGVRNCGKSMSQTGKA